MNDPKDSLPPRWNDLVAHARRDQPPALDPQALLHTLRDAPRAQPVTAGLPAGWWPEFAGLFGSRAVLAGVAVATVALGAVVLWQTTLAWEEVMPWAELIAGDEAALIGGVL
ncbi:MAG TPA: hypothetical protein VGD88_03635 [Opitutaceae bacterium]